jgi:hypothetical protein
MQENPTKAECRSRAISQSPRGATSTQKRLGEAQRVRVRVGKQTNLPGEVLAPGRGCERHRLRVGVGQQANLPKWDRWWILELISRDRWQHSKLNCHTMLGDLLTK